MRALPLLVGLLLLAGCADSPNPRHLQTPAISENPHSNSMDPSNGSAVPPGTSSSSKTGSVPTQTGSPTKPEIPPFVDMPHVLVGVADDSVNVYHHVFYRPNQVAHPCTYIPGYPCSIPALNLSVGGTDWQSMVNRDESIWASFKTGHWYWIPQTSIVAIACDPERVGNCILPGDAPSHGTGTMSSVAMENPEALLAFYSGSYWPDVFHSADIPVDIVSNSIGPIVPTPIPSVVDYDPFPYLVVQSAGNTPNSILLDGSSGTPYVVAVGGAYAADRSEAPESAKQADVVSYFCRPTVADHDSTGNIEGTGSSCGTSFAAPTVAGALSRVVLDVRRHTGYGGSVQDRVLDPLLPLSIDGLREAMNLTASWNPAAEYPDIGGNPLPGVPLNDQAPWLQWGWGFYDAQVANATTTMLLGGAQASKPQACFDYMVQLMALRNELYG